MITRPAEPPDALAIATVLSECWRSAYLGFVPDSFLDSLDPTEWAARIRLSLEAGPERTLLAEQDGTLLGLTTFGPCRDEDMDAGVAGELWGLYVPPEHWREGVGTALREAAEAELCRAGMSDVVTWVFESNAVGRRFYEGSGYTSDGSRKMVEVGAAVPALRYRKELPCLEPADGADAL